MVTVTVWEVLERFSNTGYSSNPVLVEPVMVLESFPSITN